MQMKGIPRNRLNVAVSLPSSSMALYQDVVQLHLKAREKRAGLGTTQPTAVGLRCVLFPNLCTAIHEM